MNRRLAVLIFAAICFALALCSCSPLQALSHGGHHRPPSPACATTTVPDPSVTGGQATCVHGQPVFAPPDWVAANSATPFANGDPSSDPYTNPSLQPTPIPHGP